VLVADVNLLIDAFRSDTPRHVAVRRWLERAMGAGEPILVPGVVASGFLRVVTNRRVFAEPDDVEDALAFMDALFAASSVRRIEPGPGHWQIFASLCRRAHASGDRVPDAWLAALALEHRATLVTADRGFARYPGLRWRDPADD
jgi:toxin-antitoxin system PIN domain toxin